MKLSVIGAGIFGALRQTNLRQAFGAPIVKWASRLLSSTEILSAFLGRATSTEKLLPLQLTKVSRFFRGFATADISTASIQNISKSLSLLVR
jgi:hypothetical protein